MPHGFFEDLSHTHHQEQSTCCPQHERYILHPAFWEPTLDPLFLCILPPHRPCAITPLTALLGKIPLSSFRLTYFLYTYLVHQKLKPLTSHQWVSLYSPATMVSCFSQALELYFLFVFINFYWSVVVLQCWLSFYCTAKWISYMYTYISYFLDFLPIQVTTEHWVEFPVLFSRFSLVI